MSNEATVRYIGSIMRQTVQSHYSGNGSDFGYRVARRGLFEIASCIADNHSVEDAVELCYRVGDRLAGLNLAGAGATVVPGEELLPGPRAKLAEVEAAAPDPTAGLPEHTIEFSGGTVVITGDLADARDQLLSALANVEAKLPPPERPPWFQRLWADVKLHWQPTILGFVLGLMAAGPR